MMARDEDRMRLTPWPGRGGGAWIGVTICALTLGHAAQAAPAAAVRLSPAQSARVAREIAAAKLPQDRAVAAGWSEAKKAAEFICRPLARTVLARQFEGADRVFLGSDDPATLRLVSPRRLEGWGQVRVPDGWREFNFSCAMDPASGRAVAFQAKPVTGPAKGPAGR